MRTDTAPTPTLLKNYKPPNFKIDSVYLDFDLSQKKTRVKSKMQITRVAAGDLELDGEEINLVSVTVNDKVLSRSNYRLTQNKLILTKLPDQFTLEIENTVDPSANSTLMGLYVSGGRFCTQCEAEGFRRITYYLDRPDAMSVFTVRIEAPKKSYPYLLANGNMIESGDASSTRHYAVWHDPFPKPAYLFALVAGEFDILEDSFTTMSGRHIPLTIYVDPGDAGRAEYAMDALKRSMKWDEEAFGREYDLDRFMIVAVRDFNFGAMENKGLNIFNSSLLLADAKTATDMNFERIESVVAHEYFHNWTGNRITCRDWFQLCLKEGFTVFRDQEFSADQRGAAVQRIKDVRALRGRQFPEDNGPLAHPVRPKEYLKIDNFYTATIYEKGAEVIRVLKTYLGAEKFRQGSDQYFIDRDGTASTIEEFLESFETATGEDLSQFMRWYEQAGTPRLTVTEDRSLTTPTAAHKITFAQKTPPTPGQAGKAPVVLPIKWQLISDDGPVNEPQMTVLTTAEDTVSLPRQTVETTLSVLQDFSAPVILEIERSTQDQLRLMGQDPNAFNRWEAGQALARRLLGNMTKSITTGRTPKADRALLGYCNALRSTLTSTEFDNQFKALCLTLPSHTDILQSAKQSDPLAIEHALNWLSRAVGEHLQSDLLTTYHALESDAPFRPDADSAGRRALRNRCLALLASAKSPVAATLATEQYKTADNMTDEISALVSLTRLGGQRVKHVMDDFYNRWKAKPLVIDKWFSVQSMRHHAGGIDAIRALTEHADYARNNPNRVRSLVGGFAHGNVELFHKLDGSGYRFFTEQVMDMDTRNPSVAARLLGVFEVGRKLDKTRQALIQDELAKVIASKPSKNVLEIAQKMKTG
ncbi:aminopeptidase N [Litorimonas sp. RW-G-Af-16]|uniref:aminopeptidase N n=1 Tax=Litorimonas sp. RW-G-Af-16 TaxID=3241168 RepID=UPI00390C5B60